MVHDIIKWPIYSILILLTLLGLCACNQEFENYRYEPVFDFDLNPSSEYVIVLGDIQEYTYYDSYAPYYMKTVNWIRGMYKRNYTIDCVLQTGDLTNTNDTWQYNLFRKYTKYMAQEVLFVPVTGNHDYDWENDNRIYDRSSTLFNKFVYFQNTIDHVAAYYQLGRRENIIVRNQIRGRDVYIIALEFAPRPEVVEWAKKYVENNPDKLFILLTHEWLNHDGRRENTTSSYARKQFEDRPNSSPEEIWEKLVYPNDNIRAVVCGHNVFSCLYYSENCTGRNIPQILFNVQYLPHGGNSMLQLWEIPLVGDSINVNVINAKKNCLMDTSSHTPLCENETIQYKIKIF